MRSLCADVLGFLGSSGGYDLDDLTLKSDTDGDGTYETTELVEHFTLDSAGYAPQGLIYDAAGNLTYDGAYQYAYDAWNRLVKVTHAYREATDDGSGDVTLGDVELGSVADVMQYDGLGRRIVKKVQNSADLDCTYNYYYTGQSVVEVRDGSNLVLKQYVWNGAAGGYIDDLVQIAMNDDPTDTTEATDPNGNAVGLCESFYYALQGPNYDVWGVIDASGGGALTERYQYTPYGERQVYTSTGSDDPDCYSPAPMSERLVVSGVAQPYGLNPFGHQGLMHEEELSTGGAVVLPPFYGPGAMRVWG